jgi:hypothetical protein
MWWLRHRIKTSFVYCHTSPHTKSFIFNVSCHGTNALPLFRISIVYGTSISCWCSVVKMDQSTPEVLESPSSTGFVDTVQEKFETSVGPISPPPSSRNTSHESLPTSSPRPGTIETPLRPGRRLPASPSTQASTQGRRRSISGAPETTREKSPGSLLSLSDYGGSEDSHAERRFLRQCEELESHCSGITLFQVFLI